MDFRAGCSFAKQAGSSFGNSEDPVQDALWSSLLETRRRPQFSNRCRTGRELPEAEECGTDG
jgi:hypothetical protein